jgi:hypothetical protein
LGGFFGKTDGAPMRQKAAMLRAEGVPFIAPDVVDPAAMIG